MHLGFANYPEWERFNTNFPCFVDKQPFLEALRDKMFVRKIHPTHQADYIIYGLGRVCVEDFEQILNLCGNGFGMGAMQLLRSMYERQVTAAFISKYPNEWDAFATYDAIHTRKLVQQFKVVYEDAPAILNSIVSEEEQAKIDEQKQQVKRSFMKTKCRKCKTEELMFSWNKLDVGTMAGSGHQPALKDLFPYSYFLPLLMSHSTFKSVEARVEFKEDGSFSFESDGQRNAVKKALVFGHHLLIHVFDLQNDPVLLISLCTTKSHFPNSRLSSTGQIIKCMRRPGRPILERICCAARLVYRYCVSMMSFSLNMKNVLSWNIWLAGL